MARSFSSTERVPDLLLELSRCQRRPLHSQELAIACFADELPVFLQTGHGEDPTSHFFVGRAEPEPVGFCQLHALFDHLLEDLLFDLELSQHLVREISAVRVGVGLQLQLVAVSEVIARDVSRPYPRHSANRRRFRPRRRSCSENRGCRKITKVSTTSARLHFSQFLWRRIRSSIVMRQSFSYHVTRRHQPRMVRTRDTVATVANCRRPLTHSQFRADNLGRAGCDRVRRCRVHSALNS